MIDTKVVRRTTYGSTNVAGTLKRLVLCGIVLTVYLTAAPHKPDRARHLNRS